MAGLGRFQRSAPWPPIFFSERRGAQWFIRDGYVMARGVYASPRRALGRAVELLVRESVVKKIEQLRALDAVAERLQWGVGALVPARSRAKDALSGTWLGHPLHPPLTDLVVGTWTSALLLDLVGGEGAEDAADLLVGVGVLAAVPTALSGLSDWADVRGANRRVGTLHAIGNTTALALQVVSWFARRSGHRPRGRLLRDSLSGPRVSRPG